ncbi:SDR family NAD(P)-dependent oxidoreductase [Sphingobacterium thalpophilum]|uniref:Levodione reductase n=1 Tax=Sphingobacterium thalpophilum TaxID=259 RepID=A0A4U9UA95_9SPHI|nr:glucose 1-dehydrogenase [Sphingobacterium thalpophilum]VTR29473.1 Levodione reductase [Sphingobacterium thalpophilum]
MKIDFTGKVALITGAGSGMGLATAEAFLDAGASVVLSGNNYESIKEQADRLSAKGKTLALKCDVSNEQEVKALIENTVKEFGRIDAAYNNAGIMPPFAEIAEADTEDFISVHDVNLKGVWLCVKYQVQQMLKQGSGTIVNCASMGAIDGVAGRTIYCSTKHGVVGITKSAALEYASKGIRINAVCPGVIDTPMVSTMLTGEADVLNALINQVPIKRLGRADEIAQAVLWLSSEASSFVVGHSLVVDGGITIQ